MDGTRPSHDFLGHFERHTIVAPDIVPHPVRMRGVGWVLRWAAAVAVLFFAASVLIEFGHKLTAEHALLRAARAGGLEATLPRATRQSITEAVERRLTAYPSIVSNVRLVIEINGQLVRGAFRPKEGDRLSITVATSSQAVVPGWVRTLKFWRGNERIEVRVERTIPGRFLNRPSAI